VGDTLLMYTDGVNEAFNEQWEEYGDERMQSFLEKLTGKSCPEVIAAQLEDVRAFAGSAPQSDDITLMAIKRKA
jgi:sigma-B regulation protein RsbU (phosphoserine phosphatase)